MHPIRRLLAGLIVSALLLLGGAVPARAWSREAAAGPSSSGTTQTGTSTPGTPTPGTPRPETIVGLGDSVTSGYGADFSYVEALAAALTTAGTPARADNQGVAGLTTGWLAAQLSLPTTQAALARARVVVITIGANDFSVEDADSPDLPEQLAVMRAEVDRILVLVHRYAPAAQVVLTGYWNAFADASVTDAGQAYTERAMGLTGRIDAELAQAAAANGGRYVDLGAAFQAVSSDWSTLLTDDGDHPNDTGQQAIAAAIARCLADPPAGSLGCS